jgi:hypothetical protein
VSTMSCRTLEMGKQTYYWERSLSPWVTAARTALLAEVHAATSYAFRSPQAVLKHPRFFVTRMDPTLIRRSGLKAVARLRYDKTGTADANFDATVFEPAAPPSHVRGVRSIGRLAGGSGSPFSLRRRDPNSRAGTVGHFHRGNTHCPVVGWPASTARFVPNDRRDLRTPTPALPEWRRDVDVRIPNSCQGLGSQSLLRDSSGPWLLRRLQHFYIRSVQQY